MDNEETIKILDEEVLKYIAKNKEELKSNNKKIKSKLEKEIELYKKLFYQNIKIIDLHKKNKPSKLFKNKYKKWERELIFYEKINTDIYNIYINKINQLLEKHYIID